MFTLFAAVFLSAVPGDAQDTIVVTGTTSFEERIDDYVSTLSAVESFSPMSRYEEGKYCPRVIGLSQGTNAAIEQRMRTVADAIGVKPAGEDCWTSALVVIAEDRAAMFETFKKEHGRYFRTLSRDPIDYHGMEDDVLSWSILARIDRNGGVLPRGRNGAATVEVPTGMTRTQAATREVVAMSVVLVDIDAITGLSTTQVADMALMRTLIDGDPARLANPDSILAVTDAVEGESAPASLTQWDFAYLKARYASEPWLLGRSQRAQIRGDMRRTLLPQGD